MLAIHPGRCRISSGKGRHQYHDQGLCDLFSFLQGRHRWLLKFGRNRGAGCPSGKAGSP